MSTSYTVVAVSRTVDGNTDVWLLDGAPMRLVTFDPASDCGV